MHSIILSAVVVSDMLTDVMPGKSVTVVGNPLTSKSAPPKGASSMYNEEVGLVVGVVTNSSPVAVPFRANVTLNGTVKSLSVTTVTVMASPSFTAVGPVTDTSKSEGERSEWLTSALRAQPQLKTHCHYQGC